jgi:hypothetical protein
VVVSNAAFCKDCGAPLGGGRFFSRNPGFNPVMAALLSVIPGLGHLYKGRVGAGVGWFFGVTFAYTANPALGLLLHVICASNAALKGAIDDEAMNHLRRNRRRRRPMREGY